MSARVLRGACAVVVLAAASASLVHVPLHNPSNLNPLYWSTPSNIPIVINATGSADITDGSHFTALRNAIDAWNQVPGSSAQLIENTSPSEQARTDFQSSIHLILFDESNSSGYFPVGSGTVAITPVYFYGSGQIADADILFNGSGFQFATDADPARFDVQGVAAHELGHLLGLDHSGWAGATMYPYVAQGVLAQRSLSRDDQHGLRERYPAQSFGTLTGTVRRASDSTVVQGAHVVVRDAQGRTAGAALSATNGTFQIEGLDAGTYTPYATPLDFPVSSANLTAGHTIQTDFASTLGTPTVVGAGATVAYGNLDVGADATLSLGRNYDTLPAVATIGATTTHTLRGSGMSSSCTLQASDPALTITPLLWTGSTAVNFQVSVPAGAATGHVDLEVIDIFAQRSVLPAALELTPAAPTVFNCMPPQSNEQGGVPLIVLGTGFASGARVVIGSNVYVDGAAGGCTVVDQNTITLTTAATAAGTYDVVVIDASGVEGRFSGHEFLTVPEIDSVFPTAGSDLGGTLVTLVGTNFQDPMLVRIDGVLQTQVVVESSTILRVTTDVGIAGGPYVLEVENASAQVASAAFTYVAQADPAIASFSPDSASTDGGTVVTLSGSNFDVNTRVFFDVDADTGLGGTEATAVVLLDASTLEVTTPAHAGGDVAVMVQDDATGQASVLAAAFTFSAPSGGGGGGGCYTVPSAGPWSARDALAGSAWLLILIALLATEAARLRRRVERSTSAAK